MIEFAKISQMEHLPDMLFDRLLAIPKSDAAFLLPMFDGERRSGRTTRLSVFYADMLIKRGHVKIIDHFFSEDSRKMHERDVSLSKMVVKEMESRGYLFGIPRVISGIGHYFYQTSGMSEVPCFAMATQYDLDSTLERWHRSINHCDAFNKFMERKNHGNNQNQS